MNYSPILFYKNQKGLMNIHVIFKRRLDAFFLYFYNLISRTKQAYKDGPYIKILIILTIIGLILRLYHMGDVSLWLDEVLVYNNSQQSFLEIVKSSAYDPNPPLFYWIEHIMLHFGSSEFILRLAPAIIGTITIPVIYFVGTEFYDRNVGLITASLLTFSEYHLWYSQEARPYSLVLFLFLIALIFYFKALRTDSVSYWLLFGFFVSLACWAHYSVLIILPGLFLWMVISRVGLPLKKSFIKPTLLTIVAFLLLLSPIILDALRSFYFKFSETPNWGDRGPDLIISIIGNFSGSMAGSNFVYITIFIILCFLGFIQLFRTNPNKFLFLVITILVPLTVGYWISYMMPTVSRYFIVLIAFFYIGIAFFFLPFKKYFMATQFLCIVVLFIAIISIPSLNSYYSLNSKGEDWKGISHEIQNVTDAGDIIVIVPPWYIQPFGYYYNNTTYKTYIYQAEYPDEIERIVLTHPREDIFFINTYYISESYEWINANSTLIKKSGYHYIYKLK